MSVSDIDLVNMFTKYMAMNRAGSSGTLYTGMINDLRTEIFDLSGQIAILDAQEETYNEQYLDARENPKKFGLFGNLGVRTTQDWVFAFFYFSYAIFGFLLLLTLVKNSQRKFMTALYVTGIGLFVTLIITVLLISYA